MDIRYNEAGRRTEKRPACFIFGAGEFFGLQEIPKEGDLVIAADGGLRYTEKEGIRPDIIIGDFDSGSSNTALSLSEKYGSELIRLNVMKDVSDSSAAIALGRQRGYELFYIYGCTGGRLDHSLASLQDIAALSKDGIEPFLYDKNAVLCAVHNGSLSFPSGLFGYVSVFSHTDISKGVFEEGLKYELSDKELTNNFPLGLSNELIGKPARIGVKEGILLIYIEIK